MKITNNKPTFAFTGFQNVTSGGNMNRTINDSYLVLSAELNNNDSPDLDRFKKYLSKDNILTVSNKNVPSGRYKFLPEGTSIFEINGCPLEIDSEILNIFSHEELKQIEKMVKIDKPETFDKKTFKINFNPTTTSYKDVLKLKNLSVGYTKELFNIDLNLEREDKLGIIGDNGIVYPTDKFFSFNTSL